MRIVLLFCMLFYLKGLCAQETFVLLKEADNFEKSLKENEALDKYKQVLLGEPNNCKALVKATELSCRIGGRAVQKSDKKLYFETALAYANRAVIAESSNADAYYALALACGKMTEVETDNKKIVSYVKEIAVNAQKALALNPVHGKANYVAGKWHCEMFNLNGLKKAAVKLLYGGLPIATMDSAIYYMEKCRTYEPYFVVNYVDLAKAYELHNKTAKQIEILEKLVKLPNRTADDANLKSEAQKKLSELL